MSIKTLLSVLLVSMLLVVGAASTVLVLNDSQIRQAALVAFTSETELLDYLDRLRESTASGFGDFREAAGVLSGDAESGYSGTNVQVEGVDELDRVKTDGEFIYIAHGSQITIIRAYPPEEMAVVHQISLEDLLENDTAVHLEGLFILPDRLIVVSSTAAYFDRGGAILELDVWEPQTPTTVVSVLAVTSDSEPLLLHSFGMSGTYAASRMTSDHVYIITREYIPWTEANVTPSYCVDSNCSPVDMQDVYYDPDADVATDYINIMAVDPVEGDSERISIVAGFASTVYMSHENLYIAHATGMYQIFLPRPFGVNGGPGPSTSIFRIGVDGTDLWVAAGGSVRGTLLNQFSLDERESYLRVVTTDHAAGLVNNVYILDEALRIVGALEGLAPGEQVYSARFLEDALYLVTFKKIDPFFVIDLSTPTTPRVLGYLKIPGFSAYLHPIGDGFILGVGKDTVEAVEGDFAWFQGLKLSLFDVRDVEYPREIGQIIIGDRGTESLVLWDHKAFLPMLDRGLFSLPVSLAEVNESWYPDGVPPNAHGELVWQGLYVIAVSPDEGFSVHGTVAHTSGEFNPYEQYDRWIWRSLYIGDYLYTVSDTMLKVNGIEDLEPINDVIYGE